MSYLYVAENDFGLVKIGVSKDVIARKKSLESASGVPVQIRAAHGPFGNAYELERKLHKIFAETRKVGEWFKEDPYEVCRMAKSISTQFGEAEKEIAPTVNPEEVNTNAIALLTEREKSVLETFARVLPTLSKDKKRELLAFGEGMAFLKDD